MKLSHDQYLAMTGSITTLSTQWSEEQVKALAGFFRRSQHRLAVYQTLSTILREIGDSPSTAVEG